MSLYDLLYRRFVYPQRIRTYAPDLCRRLDQTRRDLAAENLDELVSQRLREIVVHAHASCPFWSRRFDEAGIEPRSVERLEDLRALPLLEKLEIREHLDEMTSERIAPERLQADFTGGSTAAPMRFYRDPDCVARRVAHEWVFMNWYGRRPTDRWGHIWGAQKDIGATSSFRSRLRSQLLDRAIVLPGNQLSPELIDAYLRRMRSFRPKFLHAYSQAVYFVARHVVERGAEVPDIKAVTVTAEPISKEQKKTIHDAFGCPTYAIYGTRECGMIAAEAPGSDGMHINPLNALVEFLRPDGSPAQPGEPGQVVVTDLLNHATPLIRYRIGDIGIPIAEDTAGSRGMPRMELTAGRETDFLATAEGRFVAGAALTLITEPGVRQLQYLQTEPDAVTVNYVKGSAFGDGTLESLRQKIATVVGDEFDIRFREVNEIPLLPSGKLQYVRSEVARERLQVKPESDTSTVAD